MAAVNNGPAADQPSQMRRERWRGRLIARESLAGKRRYQPTIRSFRFLATMVDTNKHRGTGRCPTTNFESVEKKKKERKALSLSGREKEGERTEKRSHPGRCIAFALSVTKKPCPRANLSLVFFFQTWRDARSDDMMTPTCVYMIGDLLNLCA